MHEMDEWTGEPEIIKGLVYKGNKYGGPYKEGRKGYVLL